MSNLAARNCAGCGVGLWDLNAGDEADLSTLFLHHEERFYWPGRDKAHTAYIPPDRAALKGPYASMSAIFINTGSVWLN